MSWRWGAPLIAASALVAFAQQGHADAPNPLLQAVGDPDDLTLNATIRSRVETIDGQFRPADAHHDTFVSLRTDIFAEYHPDIFLIGAELRDARGYGERKNSSVSPSDVNALEPLQAYVGLSLPNMGSDGSRTQVKVGRFTLALGSERLIGSPDYSDSINSYTGILEDWRAKSGDRVVLFWTMPSTRLPSTSEDLHDNDPHLDLASPNVQFFGADLTKTHVLKDVSVEAYLYGLAEARSTTHPNKGRHLLTYGARVFRAHTIKELDFEIEAARQSGHERATSAETDHNSLPVVAYLAHAELGYSFALPWRPRLSLHADLATGNNANKNHITRFDTLYGATRTDFGPAGLYGPLTRSNIRSLGLRLEVAPSNRVSGFVMARALQLDSRTDSFASTGVQDETGRSGSYAGTQIEEQVRYWVIPRLIQADFGAALLMKGVFLRNAPDVTDKHNTKYLFTSIQFNL